MRFYKLDWKPDTGMPPRVISGTRVVYHVLDTVETTPRQRIYFPILMALLSKDVGIDEARVDAMIQEGGLGNILVKPDK